MQFHLTHFFPMYLKSTQLFPFKELSELLVSLFTNYLKRGFSAVFENVRSFISKGQYPEHGKIIYFMILLKILFPLTNLALSQRQDQWASGRRKPRVCQEYPLLGWWHLLKLQKGQSSRGQAAGVSVPGPHCFSTWTESGDGTPGFQVPEGTLNCFATLKASYWKEGSCRDDATVSEKF